MARPRKPPKVVYKPRRSKPFEVTYYDQADIRRRRYFDSEREAESFVNRLSGSLHPDMTVRQFIVWWLEDQRNEYEKPATYDHYSALLRRHVLGEGNLDSAPFADKKLIELEGKDIARFINEKRASSWIRAGVEHRYSHRTLEAIRKSLQAALVLAVEEKLLDHNPADARYATDRKAKRNAKYHKPADDLTKDVFSISEAQRLFEALISPNLQAECGINITTMFLLRLATGLRPGEAYALTIADVDLDGAKLSISKSLEACGKAEYTKTGKDRYVPLNLREFPFILPILDIYIADVVDKLPNNPKRLLFPTPYGEYLDEKAVYSRWRKIIIPTAGVPHRSPYNLRHTWTSILINNGRSIPEVARWQGSSVSNIASHYLRDTGSNSNKKAVIGAMAPKCRKSSWQVVENTNAESSVTLLSVTPSGRSNLS